MPAKKQVTKEALIEAAFELVRSEGMEALNMRALAKKCNCSTQPIYLSFSGADELKAEVAKKITSAFDKFIGDEIAKGQYPEYKAIGMGYIRFAKEEKELFKYLLMRNRTKESDWETGSFDKSTFTIMKNYGLYKDEASKLHAEMWLFVHGIATMFATGYLDWDWESVSEMVTDVFKGLTNKN
ncbi:MAG: TetR/AcrR family transcriptional regulator [Clostridia bacterium]|nr:TetR/AcrR family transcriptional regulator [Clostridia bacterium]